MTSSPSPSTSSSTSPLIPISLTASSLGSHLLPTEEVLSLCPSVGLYAGSSKLPQQQDGTAYLTSHRIIYIDSRDARTKSGYLPLAHVKMTEYYAGFLKSSPKVILGLKSDDGEDAAEGSRAQLARMQDELANATASATLSTGPVAPSSSTMSPASQERWICPVCSFSNNTGPTDGVDACQLCGVKRDPRAVIVVAPPPASRPRPLSSSNAAAPPATKDTARVEIACPTCTFLNHPSMPRCEICDSALGSEPIATPNAGGVQTGVSSLTPSPGTTPRTRPSTPAPPPPAETTVKLSFRKGGDRAFNEALGHAMRRAAWKASSSISNTNHKSSGRPSPAPSPRPPPSRIDIDGRSTPSSSASTGPVVGIDGLLTAYNSRSAAQRSDMSDALRDLEAFMAKAKQMVDLAENLNARLTKKEAEEKAARARRRSDGVDEDVQGEDEGEDDADTAAAATLIRSSLVQLGLPTRAVTKEMARDEEEYHEGLARELASVLLIGSSGALPGLMAKGKVLAKGASWPTINATAAGDGEESDTFDDLPSDLLMAPGSSFSSTPPPRGILGLDEVWVLWNRLRGFGALLPPSLLLAVLPILPRITKPSIDVRVFPGPAGGEGLKVLHTPRFGSQRFARRTVRRLLAREGEERREKGGDRKVPLEGLTTLRLAQLEGLSLRLTYDLLAAVEGDTGAIVRDDGGGATGGGDRTQWFRNIFEELAKRDGLLDGDRGDNGGVGM